MDDGQTNNANPNIPSEPISNQPVQVNSGSQAKPQISIHWQASEFVVHHKPAWWYAAFILVSIVFASIFLFLLRDLVAAVAILIVFGLAFTMANRQPRTLNYALDDTGVTVGDQTHDYASFRSFSVIRDGALDSIFLYPLQRFAMPIIIYFAPEDTSSIIEALSFRLPHEEREMSFVDKLSRNLRF